MKWDSKRLLSFTVCLAALAIVLGDNAWQATTARADAQGRFHGIPRIVDGDSLILGHEELRLLCMDAVELHQDCENANANDYPCGVKAKQAIADLIAGRAVACYGRERDKYNRPLVHCRVGTLDLSEEMVKQGWAIGTCPRTKAMAKEAKEKAIGIWQGRFLSPPTWRKKHPRPAAASTPQQKTPWPVPSTAPTPPLPTPNPEK